MILTGTAINQEVDAGRIVITPFDPGQLNPNSYNYRLGEMLKVYEADRGGFHDVEMSQEGFVLEPGRTYLGHTAEVIGSGTYAMSLIGRSSIGRLGLFLQVSANLGHVTSCHQWTLELVASRSLRIRPGMVVGQVSFWQSKGELPRRRGYYATFNKPVESVWWEDQK